MNPINGDEIPMGFGMALMQNPEAYMKFFELSQQRRDALINGTHNVKSKDEMRDYVNRIAVTD